MSIQSIHAASAEEWLASLPAHGTAILYKYSSICGISDLTDREVEDFVRRNPAIPVHSLDVIESRPLSDALAQLLGVRHSSPQVIVIEDRRAVWHESHYGISAESLEEHFRSREG